MSRIGYEGEGVPDRLQNKTIETMFPDTLYVPAVDSFTDMNEIFYIDKNQASGLGRLVVDGRQDLRLVESDDSLDEMVVLMKVWVQDSKGELREYIIADCRYCDDQFDLIGDDSEVDFTDQETAWGEIDYMQHRVTVSAVIDSIDKGKIGVWAIQIFMILQYIWQGWWTKRLVVATVLRFRRFLEKRMVLVS